MRKLITVFWLALAPVLIMAQGVTTSSMSGTVMDANGDPLPGAAIKATHQPTGSVYGTTTLESGKFTIPNMRVGGPYKVEVSFIGFSTWTKDNIQLQLGAEYRVNITLEEGSTTLADVEVVASSVSSGATAGSNTQISTEQIKNLPNNSRGINDFMRLTPEANTSGSGISFAGVNNRFNALYIDGAVNNDVFGLASNGTNGGQTGITPFSVDIIDQLQIVLSPYDVTYGGFAGGGINAVTRSGTNNFTGTAYTFFKNESTVGKTNRTEADRFGIDRERVDEFTENIYGVSVGGPLVKDKVFFFTNVEVQDNQIPQPFTVESYTSEQGRSSVADLNNLRSFLQGTYGYDPGDFGGVTDELDGLKFFGKIDWNINENHTLTARHQYTKAEQTNLNTGNSGRIQFANTGLFFPSTTNSSAIELNSRFGNKFSNNLIVSYVSVRDDRDPIGGDFPYVIIEDGSNGEIQFGSEQFSTANGLDQDILTITDNFKVYKGRHTLTFGTHNEFYSIYNLFIRQNFGVYRFGSLNDFISGNPADEYRRSYSLVDDITGDGSAAAADFNAMQLGFYAQDEFKVNSQFTLTLGVRLDIPFITDDPAIDPNFASQTQPVLVENYDIARDITPGQAPEGQLMVSPRVGFTYDINDDDKYIIRGGAGLFTSRIPFVWPGAMFSNNGLNIGVVNEDDLPGPIDFRPDINNQYVNPNFTTPSGQLDLFVDDFKYPQIFRTNLGIEAKLPYGITAIVDGMFTKTINNIVYTNVNSDPTVDFTWTGGPDNREVFTRTSLDPSYNSIYVASNTNEGYTYNISAKVMKDWDFGLGAMIAYSYNDAEAVNEGTSSQNSSQWRGQVNINGRNNPVLGRSDFATGHRVVTALSYTYNWSENKINRTTISLFGNMQSGSPYSYIIGGGGARNLNNETGSTSRNRSLVWIPANQSEINLVPILDGDGNVEVSVAEQWNRLNAVIEDDKYLSENRGGYAEKNASWAPFTALFDVSLRQDVGLQIGENTHRLQFSLDIQNVGNMINPEWGTVYQAPDGFSYYNLYDFAGYEADGTTPTFQFSDSGATGNDRFDINGFASRWNMLIGIRYLFN